MKNLLSGLLVLAVFVPATVTRSTMPKQVIDIRESTAQQIALRASAGYHFAAVDMDGATWKEENAIMSELRAAGYKVDLTRDHKVYGWNGANGALLIKW